LRIEATRTRMLREETFLSRTCAGENTLFGVHVSRSMKRHPF
jgi:hypothetical protein